MCDSFCGFIALIQAGDQRNAHVICARVLSPGFPAQKASGQQGNMGLFKQRFCKLGVTAAKVCPKVEAGWWYVQIKRALQNGLERLEFFSVQATVFNHMFFIIPGRDAGHLNGR